MAKIKTHATDVSVMEFIEKKTQGVKRDDTLALLDLCSEISGFPPVMWGPSIIGFGQYHYRYASGHEGDMPVVAFSPRKEALVVYLSEHEGRDELLARLGKYKIGKACLYIKKLADVDVAVLRQLIVVSMEYVRSLYP
ncbi:MAG: DUF1801 domain-containing protein [Bacteroidia bacterium]|nr:DUF1801 domain-containing protein [Bacteroidia bacterium]